jgi:hypothetical protein
MKQEKEAAEAAQARTAKFKEEFSAQLVGLVEIFDEIKTLVHGEH